MGAGNRWLAEELAILHEEEVRGVVHFAQVGWKEGGVLGLADGATLREREVLTGPCMSQEGWTKVGDLIRLEGAGTSHGTKAWTGIRASIKSSDALQRLLGCAAASPSARKDCHLGVEFAGSYWSLAMRRSSSGIAHPKVQELLYGPGMASERPFSVS